MNALAIKCAIAQINVCVGDIEKNTNQILAYIQQAAAQQVDLLVFPECVLTGYPPEDLLLLPAFQRAVDAALLKIAVAVKEMTVVLGHPLDIAKTRYNAASVIHQQEIKHYYYKQCLPNNTVFDEKRYFEAGSEPLVFSVKGVSVGLLICEDGWFEQPALSAKALGAECIVHINASPFSLHKYEQRLQVVRERIVRIHIPWIYVNLCCAQDELVFDGASFVMNAQGEVTHQAPSFEPALISFVLNESRQFSLVPVGEERLYKALVLALREYVDKNHFPGILLGLSGGIDSALTLAIAVDALGAHRVRAVLMPSRYTSQLSNDAAIEQAKNMGVHYDIVSIESMFESFSAQLSEPLQGAVEGLTAENLQARCRGVILMALSNATGFLVLPTGNKSEMAVGYCTSYGDMVGGFDVLKDVLKTQVYALARYRNKQGGVIPQIVLDRPPTAELRFDQTDQDSLPPYEVLDQIIQLHMESNLGGLEIGEYGIDTVLAQKVLKMIQRSEYKRRQGAIGPRVSERAFGKDWRYPITSHWKA